MNRTIITICLCSVGLVAFAQYPISRYNVKFRDAFLFLYDNGLTGGLNTPQYSSVDLDGNGEDDLLVFDRTGGVILPFLRQTGNYTFAPQYIDQFPVVERWMLLRDYNCDGIKDIFAFSEKPAQGEVGIQIWKGSRPTGSSIVFSLVTDMLNYNEFGESNLQNLFISSIDLPAIDDIDGDGDMDILSFNPNGGYVEWFQNLSAEEGHGCDSLRFERVEDCWGRFYESGVTQQIDMSPDIDSCAGWTGWTPIKDNMHAGSTLLTIDMDGDDDKELFLGDLTFSNFTMLTNGGNADTAWMTAQEIFFPQNSLGIDLDVFPAGFWEDVDADGLKDLLVAPNALANSENVEVTWFYKNTQTNTNPAFSFQQTDFLVNQMLDHGGTSAPAFADYNNDGLVDIVLGNFGEYLSIGDYTTQLFLYKNIGTATQPEFALDDLDLGSLAQYNIRRLVPTLGDLDDDGDLDMIVGQEDGTLIYLQNTGTAQIPNYPSIKADYKLIDVGLHSSPQLVDVDEDLDLDLVIGERSGNFNYFENIGTPALADFSSTATSTTFGFIDTKLPGQFDGNSSGCMLKVNGEFHFFVGSNSGQIWHYNGIQNNIMGTFSRLNDGLDDIDEGVESIVAVQDINQDGMLDFLVGNKRGGLSMFSQDTTTAIIEIPILSENLLKIYPNPASDRLHISLDLAIPLEVAHFRIIDMLGQVHLSKQYHIAKGSQQTISVTNLPTGVYNLHIETSGKVFSQKFLIRK